MLCFLLAAMMPSCIIAQTVIMPAVGHNDTTMSYAELFDDGGPSGTYSNICNGSYTFHTVNPAGHYRIAVESFLANTTARLTIRNGTVGGYTIATYLFSGTDTLYSSGNTVSISFMADDDSTSQGFKVVLCEFDTPLPGSVSASFLDSNTAVLHFNNFDTLATWYIDYAIVDSTINFNSFFSNPANYTSSIISSDSLIVPDVPVGFYVVYRFYTLPVSECSPPPRYGNGPAWNRPFDCPCISPTGYTVTALPDSIRISWTNGTSVDYWHIWTIGSSLDTLVPGTDTAITFPYTYTCNISVVFIQNVCNYDCNFLTCYIPAGGCQQTVSGLTCTNRTSNSIDLIWNDVQDSAARYVLSMQRENIMQPPAYTVVDTFPFGTTTYSATGLEPHTYYNFMIRVICGDGSPGCHSVTCRGTTTLDNCIDYYDLHGNNNIHFTHGTYNDPALSHSFSSNCHASITDTNLLDPKTGNHLRCVPPGESVSFRLGNALTGAEAETVTFDYMVDSTDKDMLVLKYAVVMQNPNHNVENQPHFTMEILDNTGNIIDTNCCYADFAADSSHAWNNVYNTNIIWRDWTVAGIDISQYHGQNIKIRFTTKDCALSAHFGYAYFTIHCDSKRIDLINLCDAPDSVRLRAPLGFLYRWTVGDDTTVISIANEIVVPADSNLYICRASFITNPDCYFHVSSRAVLPYPKAAFDYSIDTCGQQIRLINRSHVDIDSVYLPFVRQTIDRLYWVVNGDTLLGDTLTIAIRSDTSYSVALHCSLSEGICSDSTSVIINPLTYHTLSILGDTTFCNGDTITLRIRQHPLDDTDFLWHDATTDTIRHFIATADTSFYVIFNYHSCTDTVFHHIRVLETNNDTLVLESCPGGIDTLGFREKLTGTYTQFLTNRYGCDSLSTLDLTVHPAFYDTVSVVTCDEPFFNFEFSEDSSGDYTHTYSTLFGCDSIYHLHFLRHKGFYDSISVEIYYGDKYVDDNFSESEAGTYHTIHTDSYGCDSVYTLTLNTIRLLFPNAVTPDGDGYNDILEIVGLMDATIFDTPRLYVYNRWGRLVYRCDNIRSRDDFWNPQKTNSPDGTYFYRFIVNTHGHNISHTSVVEVIRKH